MPLFSQSTLDQVRAASDIVDVIGACLPLKRNGANFVTLCPFHKEKSPSFNVNPQKQIFHCFGCGKGGNVFRFVQDYENLSFVEAVQRLAERARITLITDDNPAAAQARGLKDQLLKLHEAICLRWQQCLANEAGGQVARDYLERRGVSPDAVKEFRIGAAPESWDDTVNWARAKGFDHALCEQAGLIIHKEDSDRRYDRFRGRLMFPICDEQGRVIAFSGRILQGDEKTAKYVNSPETLIFTKGRVLYALDKAKRAILDAGHAIVCEGQLDTIACHSAGVRHVVAPQGTALTADHARILKRYVDEVILCFDGDKAGRNAAIRSLDDCLGSGLAIRVASIPPPDDPDSFLRQHGPDAFKAVLARAQGFFEFYLQHLTTENDTTTDRGRLTVVRAMADKLVKTGNAVMIDTHAQKTAQRLGVTVEAVRAEFRKVRAPSAPAAEPGPEEAEEEAALGTTVVTPPRPGQQDLWWLKFLMHADADLLGWTAAHLDPNWIIHPTVRRITELRLSHAGAEHTADLAPLLEDLAEDDFARQLVTEAASEQRPIPDLPVQVQHVVLRLRNEWIKRQVQVLAGTLGDTGLPDEQRHAALRDQQHLRAWMRQPLEPLADS